MSRKNKISLYIAIGAFLAFIIWTALVCAFDVRAIGPQGSQVGFATLNGFVHNITGVNMWLYMITDWLGLVPIAVSFGFAVLGLVQWIGRKNILKVDRDIIALGGFYVAVMALYLFFEFAIINYRPVLIGGILEASYPSSTTVLVACVMSTASMQLHQRIKNKAIKLCVIFVIVGFVAFMVIGRLFSGVHWASDIMGGVLISISLVSAYAWVYDILKQ